LRRQQKASTKVVTMILTIALWGSFPIFRNDCQFTLLKRHHSSIHRDQAAIGNARQASRLSEITGSTETPLL